MDFVTELTRFAATGRLGDFHVGAHLYDLVAAKGEPEWSDRVDEESPWPHWYCYGDLQIVFCECRLLERMYVPAWHAELEVQGTGRDAAYTVRTRVTEPELTAAFTRAGLVWQTLTYANLPDQRTLVTEPTPGAMTGFLFAPPAGDDDGRPEGPQAAKGADWVLYKASTAVLCDHACPDPAGFRPDDGYGA
ncbi:hypothetical protein ACODT5_18905 [Streptomyces sp. 5.8]|uniref:hypothetical protein n=1 Tax=Streptomyces sp. 5.8 TaxID=3406571 RepID=UPI003BB4B1CB